MLIAQNSSLIMGTVLLYIRGLAVDGVKITEKLIELESMECFSDTWSHRIMKISLLITGRF